MAFDLSTFLPLSAMANSNVPRYFVYADDTDTLATIITDDYFLDQYQVLIAGDIIRCFPAGSTTPVDLLVTASAVGGVDTEVIGGTEDLTATNTLTADDSGKTLLLNSATEFVTTLPSPVAGLNFRFICKAAPASASYTVVTAGSANILIGGPVCATADDLGSWDADGDTITFVDGQSIVGDYIDVISDGTSWYVSGACFVAEGVTVTKAT